MYKPITAKTSPTPPTELPLPIETPNLIRHRLIINSNSTTTVNAMKIMLVINIIAWLFIDRMTTASTQVTQYPEIQNTGRLIIFGFACSNTRFSASDSFGI